MGAAHLIRRPQEVDMMATTRLGQLFSGLGNGPCCSSQVREQADTKTTLYRDPSVLLIGMRNLYYLAHVTGNNSCHMDLFLLTNWKFSCEPHQHLQLHRQQKYLQQGPRELGHHLWFRWTCENVPVQVLFF